jgi:GNAT superfamily N-acetyltransferase
MRYHADSYGMEDATDEELADYLSEDSDFLNDVSEYLAENADSLSEYIDELIEDLDEEELFRYAQENEMTGGGETETENLIEEFGLDQDSLGDLVGAPDGAEVHVERRGDDLKIFVYHDEIESMERTISRGSHGLIMTNDLFVKESDAPKGLAAKIMARQLLNLKEAGFTRIKLNAAGSARPYGGSSYKGFGVWPRYGFDVGLDYFRNRPFYDKMKSRFPDAETLTDLFRTRQGREFWWENGSSWYGHFDLSEGSKSMDMLSRYLLELEKRKDKDG